MYALLCTAIDVLAHLEDTCDQTIQLSSRKIHRVKKNRCVAVLAVFCLFLPQFLTLEIESGYFLSLCSTKIRYRIDWSWECACPESLMYATAQCDTVQPRYDLGNMTTKSDIFNLACILFEWTVGKHPFADAGGEVQPAYILSGTVATPVHPKVYNKYGREFFDLLAEMMSLFPDHRPSASTVRMYLQERELWVPPFPVKRDLTPAVLTLDPPPRSRGSSSSSSRNGRGGDARCVIL